ncbi:MAG TPA: antibiotic biosynthesis monooxygenase [Candidatus Limnocylindrales bacterium]|nr:antibiotic biosynthesis monooxygenase [Candidatus Limnocylindrales bacterium]
MPIHVAITRRVAPGREEEFQKGLREFFEKSFSAPGVLGAYMLVPPPGSDSREFGILRTFASAAERDAFYSSAMFLEWDRKAAGLTEGDARYRDLHGLEAWFRSPNPPPRWKMAIVTFLGVFPVATTLNLTLAPALRSMPFPLSGVVLNACVVALLTWVVMPFLVRTMHGWLHAEGSGASS